MYQTEDKIGDYVLAKFLGRGQYGEVWLAEKKLQFSSRSVRHALKFLYKQDDEAIDLKAAESEIDTWIEASGHPNVMSVIDMFVDDERMIIVSEYADGGSVKSWLQKTEGRAPSEEAALEMMRGILLGIEHLHSKSVVHRDLKPDNILLQGDFPRITDFGISRIVSESTMSTKAIGSPAYMSPESFDGDKRAQADLWAAGVILYEMLIGAYPFGSETIYGLFEAIRNQPIKPLPETVSPSVRRIVEQALEKDQARRYQTATEMRRAVEQAIFELKTKSSQEALVREATPPIAPPQSPEASQSIETRENYQPPISAKTIPLTAQNSTGDANNVDSKPKIDLPLTQKVEADRTDEKYIAQTVGWNVPETIASGSIPQINNVSPPPKKSTWLFVGIGGGIFGLILLIGAGLLTLGLISSQPTNVYKNSNDNAVPKPTLPPPLPPKIAPPTGMAYVPGGTFTMGRDDGVSEAEKPAHEVTVKPFFMDVYEVSNGEYSVFLYPGKSHQLPPRYSREADGTLVYNTKSSQFPAAGVTWQDADNFCKNAGKRLPSEEEWEFATRGANNFLYPWGNSWSEGKANIERKSFSEVGTYKEGASIYGVYDLIGNAWEWTSSDFKAYPGGTLPAIFDGKKNIKTIRGGSFESTKEFATATYRIGWEASGAADYSRTGFRCVRDAN